jgi:hypothetical protein
MASAPSRLRQTFFTADNFWPRFSASVAAMTKIISGRPAMRKPETQMKSMRFCGFPAISRRSFCAMIAQSPPYFQPCCCRMEKLSAKCILCISYKLARKVSGKLSDVNVAASGSCSRRHRWTLAESGGVNYFSPGINNRDNHCQNPGAKFAASVASGSRRIFCTGCNFVPPFSASVAAMTKIISNRPAMWKSEILALHVFETFHFDQGLVFEAVGAAKEKTSWGKSCAENALDDFNALIALLRMSNAVAHKNLADAGKCFNGHRMKTHCFAVGGMTAARAGCCHLVLIPPPIAALKPNKAFCFKMKRRPVSFQIKSQIDGRITGQNEKKDCSPYEQGILKNR